ncbi:MAG: type II toxin-antitoxin system MqsA family antitoxin [Bradymonadia bacterium]
MSKQNQCPACGALGMVREVRVDSMTYTEGNASRTREFSQPGLWCKHCNEAVFTDEEAEIRESIYIELRAEVRGIMLPTPGQARRIIQKLKLR